MRLYLLVVAIVSTLLEEIITATTNESLPPSDAVVIDAAIEDDFGFSDSPELPDITPFSRSDPNRNEQIKKLFNQILPQLKHELPAYNMAAIDPYFYKRGIFRYSGDGIEGGMLIKDMLIHGISDIKVNNILSNFTNDDRFMVRLSISLPELKAGGNFKADVKFGGLRIVPRGLFNITVENIRSNILTEGRIENGASGQRVQLTNINANVVIGKARVLSNGIFSDKNLNTMMLNLINQNLPEIVRVGIPATRDQWAPILVEHINNFFNTIPIEKFMVD